MRTSKAEKEINRRIGLAIYGVQIPMMQLGKVIATAERLIAEGKDDATLRDSVQLYVATGCIN